MSKLKRKSLSEKISEVLTPKALLDPEDHDGDETAAQQYSHELDVDDFSREISGFRKSNTKLLSELDTKYRGRVSNRRTSYADDSEASINGEKDEDEEEDGSNLNGFDGSDSDELHNGKEELFSDSDQEDEHVDNEKDSQMSTEIEDEESENDSDISDDDEDFDSEDDQQYSEDIEEESNLKIIETSNTAEEIQKGLSIQNQLKFWEKLLELRIHSQKLLSTANTSDSTEIDSELSVELNQLMCNLLKLQSLKAKRFPDTSNLKLASDSFLGNGIPSKKRKVDYSQILADNLASFKSYRNSVIQKWYNRTKVLHLDGKKNNAVETFDTVKKIETALLMKDDLIAKSQIYKGDINTLPESKRKEMNLAVPVDCTENDAKPESYSSPEMYDDSDFYHDQLRELIEFKSNTSSDPNQITKQMLELQKLRSKTKKKVDQKASKGRKIRYIVHKKLSNFMAPNEASEWTDESKTELFNSLFGVHQQAT